MSSCTPRKPAKKKTLIYKKCRFVFFFRRLRRFGALRSHGRGYAVAKLVAPPCLFQTTVPNNGLKQRAAITTLPFSTLAQISLCFCFLGAARGRFRFAFVASFFLFGGGSSCCFSGLFFVRLFPVSSGCGGACCCWRRRWFSAFVSACRFRLGFRWLSSSSVRWSSSVCLPVFARWFGRRFSVGFVVRRGFPVVGGVFRRRRLGSGVGVGVASGGCVFRRRRFPVGFGWSARRRLFRLLSVGGRVCCCSRGFLFLVSRLVPVGLLCSRLLARAAGRTRRFIQRKEK